MTPDPRQIPPETAERLLLTLRGLDWPLRIEQVPALVEILGWHIIEEDKDFGAMADTRFGFDGQEATLIYGDDGTVGRIRVDVTADVDSSGAESRAFLQNAFVWLTATATRLFGTPTRRVKDALPEVRWRGEQATLSINRVDGGVILYVVSTETQDLEDEYGDGLTDPSEV